MLESLLAKVDQLIVGGGIANTFLAATGVAVGKSLYEADMLDTARKLLEQARARGAAIPLPTDVVVATEFAASAKAQVRAVGEVRPDELILDIGPQTAQAAGRGSCRSAGTILWNGPVGVFEFDQFGDGHPDAGPRHRATARPFPSPAAAIRSRPSRSMMWKREFPISPPAAARSSSSSRARRCRRSPFWKNALEKY